MDLNRVCVWAAAVLLAGCGGDNTAPSSDASPAGLWNFTFTGSGTDLDGVKRTCTTQWVANIEDRGAGVPLLTLVPYTAVTLCGNRTLQALGPGESFRIYQQADQLTFLNGAQDTFMLATYSGSSMTGSAVRDPYFAAFGQSFRASRRAGTDDPNTGPGFIQIPFDGVNVEVTDTFTLGAQVYTGYGVPITGAEVTWSSSDPETVGIEPGANPGEFRARALKPGTARIIGHLDALVDSAAITVLEPPASIAIMAEQDTVIVQQGVFVSAEAKDASGQVLPGRQFSFTSSDPTIATVDYTRVVTGVAPGLVTITAHNGALSSSVQLRVLPAVAQISVTPTSAAIPLGETVQFAATARDAGGAVLTGRPVAWDGGASPSSGLTVEANGLARALRAGTGTVTAHAELATTSVEVRMVMDGPLQALAGGAAHTCGLSAAGRVYCWGRDVSGELGYTQGGEGGTAVRLPTDQTFVAIASRDRHTCALTSAGAAWCWGLDGYGQLGQAGVSPGSVVAVAGGHVFTRLAVGSEFTCGLESGGAASCWGANAWGQLGGGSSDFDPHATPIQVTGGHAFTSIALGDRTACGLTSGGAAWCWGNNESGHLGLGTADADPHPDPVHAMPSLTFTALALNDRDACGISTAGPIWCWGADHPAPAQMDASTGWAAITANGFGFCRVTVAGTTTCGSSVAQTAFAPASAVNGLTSGRDHSCALLVADDVAICWGINDWGQLGSNLVVDELAVVEGQP